MMLLSMFAYRIVVRFQAVSPARLRGVAEMLARLLHRLDVGHFCRALLLALHLHLQILERHLLVQPRSPLPGVREPLDYSFVFPFAGVGGPPYFP